MANVMKCWVSVRAMRARVREGLLVPLGCIPHSCFSVSWTRGRIAEELWQFLITNKLLWISQQCLEAPGYRGPSCSHSLAEVTSRDSDPRGQWKMHLRCNISSGSCLLWWLSLTVQEGNERITLAKNEAHSKREEHLHRSSNYFFFKSKLVKFFEITLILFDKH